MKRFGFILGLVFLIGVFSAFTQPQDSTATQPPATTALQTLPEQQVVAPLLDDANMLAKVGEVLLVFLVLSVVFESALTPVFSWRVFRKRFDGKGVKTPIVVVLAFVVFWNYDLDIVNDILVAMNYIAETTPRGHTLPGQALTALLIAGGSSGIFNIYKKMGIRGSGSPAPKPEDKPAPPETQPATNAGG